MNTIVTIAIAITALFFMYLSFLQTRIKGQISSAMKGRHDKNMMYSVFLPMKFNLAESYPDKHILETSKFHDKLINYFYIVVISWGAFLILGNIVQNI